MMLPAKVGSLSRGHLFASLFDSLTSNSPLLHICLPGGGSKRFMVLLYVFLSLIRDTHFISILPFMYF